MSKDGRVRLRDARDAYRLIGECREIGHDPMLWRRHLLQGLCKLLDAQVAIGGMLSIQPPRTPEIWDQVDLGWPNPVADNHWVRYREDGRLAADPVFIRLCALRGEVVTCGRQRLASDAEWYRSVEFNEYRRPSGVDGWLVSVFRRPIKSTNEGRAAGMEMSLINLHRPVGEREFSARERRVLHLLHVELAPLLGKSLATSQDEPFASLSPRERDVLNAMLDGESEKLIAARLKIGVRTVHDHVTEIYRHFAVHSRGELMARLYRRPFRRPQDSDATPEPAVG